MAGDSVVIVGGGLAGLRTAEALRRQGHSGPLTLVAAEEHLPYDRPPLSKSLLTGQDPAPRWLRPEEAYAELGLDLRLSRRAVALDTARREVALDDGDALPYARLVIATGARARTIAAFARHANVLTLRTWDDCLALRTELGRARHVTVVGGGVLGCEIAASARTLGLEVTLVEALEQPLARVVGGTVGAAVAALHRDRGVDLRLSTSVVELLGEERAHTVVLSDGARLRTDLVVVAVGAAPNTEWLAGAGLELDDGVVCDATGAASAEGVFAAGDVARLPHPAGEGTVRLEHWSAAGDTAALVAANLFAAPGERRPLSEVPYFWSDQYDVKVQTLGLPGHGAEPVVVEGAAESGRFLALYAREGRVTGAVALSMPAALFRCRATIAERAPLSDALAAAPWTRRPRTPA
ncbi:NADPH-dependent 2,4-dienoyl-CoA reductase/sulfur reductase-like enzyme [Thermocatellispora tengchongensis]|uniref:NADPH-dependent 2,4-dienoyl-CoA reductase/sulfur reductase-like enzyme n=1 Tax=Thermocatellispora tengchongensis TaxID=1073253 RepID=A0A840PMP6_9ACTN|nr:FAD-dependent oxidoreductase [Thermocatellispora tengchongensis]MBB5138950.1 NADPH-dependent 2,4-dienoyl-CoA reductase/sulfur reductase-like enzyme [Thermocatellispora tengchongensis]